MIPGAFSPRRFIDRDCERQDEYQNYQCPKGKFGPWWYSPQSFKMRDSHSELAAQGE